MKEDIKIKIKADCRQVRRAKRIIEKFNKAVEKANSLADELANKEIHLIIISEQK